MIYPISPVTKLLDSMAHLKIKDEFFKKIDMKTLMKNYYASLEKVTGFDKDEYDAKIQARLDVYAKMCDEKIIYPTQFGCMMDMLSKILYMQHLSESVHDIDELNNKRFFLQKSIASTMRVPMNVYMDKSLSLLYLDKVAELADYLLDNTSSIEEIWKRCYFLVILDNQFKSGYCENNKEFYRRLDTSYNYIDNILKKHPDVLNLGLAIAVKTLNYLCTQTDVFDFNKMLECELSGETVIGEVDFISKFEIIDLKVSKQKPTSKQLQQVALYYLINHSNNVNKLTIYNPLLDIRLSIVPSDILKDCVLKDIVDRVLSA
jgi:hypothetical protein